MLESAFRRDFDGCLSELQRRLQEPAPQRIQLLAGPRQVGKTTLLLRLAQELGSLALYSSADGPEAQLPGYWERLWQQVELKASTHGRACLLWDEAPYLTDWSARLKGEWDRILRLRMPVHLVASGSSSLAMGSGSRESLAGRFERLTLSHWSAASLAKSFGLDMNQACEALVEWGAYPGAFDLTHQPARWLAYVRDSILEPAMGRDLLALHPVRKPALLRQLLAVATTSPAKIVSLQKLQGQLQDKGALETVAHYLQLLQDAHLVAPLEKFSRTSARQRAAPPKLVTLSNAFLRVAYPAGPNTPERWGAWVENACLAHAWNLGYRVTYWRQEPWEVDAVLENSGQTWAVEITVGEVRARALEGLVEFTRRYPDIQPLVVTSEDQLSSARRLGLKAQSWRCFLGSGPES